MAIWRMRNACWIPMATNTHTHTHTHTHMLCSTHSFSTATMVARSRLSVQLNVHCSRYCKTLLSASHFEQSRFCREINAVNSIFTNFNILLTVHPNIIIAFFTNLMHNSLFYHTYYIHQHVSSNIMLILRRSNCISTASGLVTLFRRLYSTQVKKGLLSEPFLNLCTAQSHKESDDTRCCTNTI